jgi:hypothetical protein
VAELRASAEGPVNVLLCNVAVTYVYVDGFFVQESAEGGAMSVYVGKTDGDPANWPYAAPSVGDVLNIQVTEFGSFKGHQQITASLPPEAAGTTDVSAYALDLSEGTLPSEELESRLVMVTGATIDQKKGKVMGISYGTATNVVFFAGKGKSLCRNATFDLVRAVVVEYTTDPEGATLHELKTWDASLDVANLDDSGCAVDDSNWDFEDWTLTDPPLGFVKTDKSKGFAVSQDTVNFHGGTSSAQVWVKTKDNSPELAQSWYMPVTVGTNYSLVVWALDNEAQLRARLILEFYDSKAEVGKDGEKYSAYTEDSADWQSLSHARVAPEGAIQLRGFIRFYDQTDEFDPEVGAGMSIDDWSVTMSVEEQ